jgi:hypothetical protein
MISYGMIFRLLSPLNFGLFIVMLLVGCAPQAEEMIAHSLPRTHADHGSVIITVSGGNSATLMQSTLVSNENFSAALIQSLRKTGLFRSVETSGNASYKLEVILENLSQTTERPSATFGLKVTWKLMRAPGQVLWRRRTEASFKATSGEITFVDLKRLRMATEEAARKNIEQALNELAWLNF